MSANNDNDADDQDGYKQGPGSPGPNFAEQFALALPVFPLGVSPRLRHEILRIQLELSSKVAFESHLAYKEILKALGGYPPPG